MSLFGTSPPGESPDLSSSRSRNLFDDDQPSRSSTSLFDDDDADGRSGSPWDMPTPRRKSRADLVSTLLRRADVPESYVGAFDKVLEEDDGPSLGKIGRAGVNRVFAAGRISSERKAEILDIVGAGAGGGGELGRNEFNVLLALVGLAQEGESVSLDAVDERRRDLPQPKLIGINAEPELAVSELAAKPPQKPIKEEQHRQRNDDDDHHHQPGPSTPPRTSPTMDFPPDPEADPWNTPDMHKGHNHANTNANTNTNSVRPPPKAAPSGSASDNTDPTDSDADSFPSVSMSTPAPSTQPAPPFSKPPGSPSRHTAATSASQPILPSSVGTGGGWERGGFYDAGQNTLGSPGGFGDTLRGGHPANPFGSNPRMSTGGQSGGSGLAPTGVSGRTGNSLEEVITLTLMPEKEGFFLFQHHNYEVTSSRRGSKVVRRYSDFVWLLECLHKRYPFRALPPLPPKRVAVNGNHFSNDRAFMEKRRRGLARFLGALVRHPVLGQEQLVVMFLTVPTELAVWRKQATISVQDEFENRALPPTLEDSLPPTLEELFARSRLGIRRSADLYTTTCNVMDRLVKRTEGVAADHGRIALSLASLTEASPDVYATDTSEVALLNDGLVALSKHLRTGQGLLEDESRAWEAGVLEDLKRQRDGLVSMRDLFDRRERLDRDNIAYLERRIEANEGRLVGLREREGGAKPGEVEKVAESIIKDKQSIVHQHNRSIFVKECLRDELRYFQASQYHVSRWCQDWAQERVKYAEVLADNWRGLLDELEGMPLGE
ncbi:related to MVP1 protein [Cephalotrichum gorgonifer]|uniref:Sorting nexin MVP1 n=1 Tax=Cephalotrichum gorgonifer TaxID=2041049 RepID=A0AAE8N089_9PEZI|nr:related to MVP1 protein [Cephalotrichum gorgonifer]